MLRDYSEVYEDLDYNTFVKALSFLLGCNDDTDGGWLEGFTFEQYPQFNQVDLTVAIKSKGFNSQKVKKLSWDPERRISGARVPWTKEEFEKEKKKKLKVVQDNIEEFNKLKKILKIL